MARSLAVELTCTAVMTPFGGERLQAGLQPVPAEFLAGGEAGQRTLAGFV